VTKDYYTDESYSGESELDAEPTSKGKITKKATSSALAKTASRQSSTSNSDAPMERRKPSASATGGGGGASSKPKSAAKPNAGAAKGQSTLAGFFKKR
jgi:DNA polymerase delta subunit 3